MESPDLSSMVGPNERFLSGDGAIQLTPAAILESPKLEAMAPPTMAGAKPLSPMTMFPPGIPPSSTETTNDPFINGFPPLMSFDNVFEQ